MDFDAIIIGSGAGGGTAAQELSRAGHSVLLIERGALFADSTAFQDETAMLIERRAGDDREFEVNGRQERLYTGGVLGGSTALYGSALLRPSPEDFRPGKYYSDYLDPSAWEWPFGYEELAPFYQEAEDLYGVAGDAAARVPYLARRHGPYPQPFPPLKPINQHLKKTLEHGGLAPFPLPLGIDFGRCLGCPTCPGYYCPNGSRASSLTVSVEPALKRGELTLWTDCEVLELESRGRRIEAVRLFDRRTQVEKSVSAKLFIVAAGAIGTPVLLIRSELGKASGQLGRNHMCHLGAVAGAVFKRSIGGATSFIKQLALTDYYFGTPEFPHKLGYVQCVPIPGVETLREHAGVPMPRALARWVQDRTILFAGAIEDLPQAENRVEIGANGRVRLLRKFHSYDIVRADFLARELRRQLRRAGPLKTLSQVASRDDLHAAHQVGTCRAGRSPESSVVDGDGRLHERDNCFVVDGSIFPTALGVGPSLTIVANSLRISRKIEPLL